MDNLDYIETYFAGEPDSNGKRAFEERIESDPAFAEEVAFYLSVLAVSREKAIDEKKQRFRKIYLESQVAGSPGISAVNSSPRVSNITRTPVRKLVSYLVAAAVAAGIVFGIYTMTSQESPQQMAEKYVRENLNMLGVTMSSRGDSIQSGLRLYNEGKTTDALAYFEQLAQSDSTNFTAKKYAGLAALRQKEYDKALRYFEQLETYGSLYANPALFYQAITLMERNESGDPARSKATLEKIVNNDLEGKEIARVWLRKM